jgi:hypothetical protein
MGKRRNLPVFKKPTGFFLSAMQGAVLPKQKKNLFPELHSRISESSAPSFSEILSDETLPWMKNKRRPDGGMEY